MLLLACSLKNTYQLNSRLSFFFLFFRKTFQWCQLPYYNSQIIQLMFFGEAGSYDDFISLIKIEIMSLEYSARQQPGNKANELKHVQQDLSVMQNRVQLLRQQLQKEKDTIKKHKSLTQNMVRKKVEISKINALKNKDLSGVESEVSHLRERNHSYRQSHRKQMDNILKAVYLVKLDEARQMKSISEQNKSLIQERERSIRAKQRQRRSDMAMSAEKAKLKYVEYWKKKLNGIYSAGQRDKQYIEQETQQRKRQLKQFQQQQLALLEEINKMHLESTDAKKEYLAALTLSSKQVEQAFQKDQGKRSKTKGPMSPRRYQREKQMQKEREWEEKVQKLGGSRVDERYKDTKLKDSQFWSKSPHVSIMSSHDLRLPRASVDPAKLKIILKELKRLDELDGK